MTIEEKKATICRFLNLDTQAERINNLSDQQADYILSPIDRNTFLNACPGSGKTEVVGIKAACEMSKWNIRYGGIAILTFTNNAASVIKDRVIDILGDNLPGYPNFIGTFDSWLHGYLVNPFAHTITGYPGTNGDHSIKLVDNSSDLGFLNSYKTKYCFGKTGKIKANQFYIDRKERKYVFSSKNEEIDKPRSKMVLEKWQIEDLSSVKMKFLQAGFSTYQDMELLGYSLLKKTEICSKLSERFPFVIIDECQDLSWIQLQFLNFLKVSGTILHFVGDLNQAIYEFKKVDPNEVKAFCQQHHFYEYTLNRNYRSDQRIVDVCDQLVSQTSTEGNSSANGSAACQFITYTDMNGLPTKFENILRDREINISESAILTRSWNNISRIIPGAISSEKSKQLKLARSLYLWHIQSKNMLITQEALELVGSCIGEIYFNQFHQVRKQHYCPSIISTPFRWRLFLAKALDSLRFSCPECFNFNQTWNEWCSLVRRNLSIALNENRNVLLDDLPENFDFQTLNGNDFRVPNYEGGNTVKRSISVLTDSHSNILITTIHAVKGQTFDAVMLVSSKDKRGVGDGHWLHWVENPSSEAARLAYVASSRPRKLLVWAVPGCDEAQFYRLSVLGFEHLE